MLVFEDFLPRVFWSAIRKTYEYRLLDVYYDSEFDPLKQVLLVEPVSIKKLKTLPGKWKN